MKGHPRHGGHGRHGPPGSNAAKSCYEFQRTGRCKYGDRCRYSHVLTNGQKSDQRDHSVHRDRNQDKLRQWKHILDQGNQTSRPTYAAVSRFFELAVELMDGEVGASQETITLLAEDAGLEFIKAVTDRHTQAANDDGAKVNLWKTQISPLFRLITHAQVLNSNVLEMEVATLYSFLLGVNATRMKRLFGFITDIAAAWPRLDVADVSLMAVLELSLAVLSKILDCSTTNILNQHFHNVVERFADLLKLPTPPHDGFSKLQAERYLDYLQRRLGVGKNMAEARDSQQLVVKQESFRLRRDLPGNLSADGPRHDNDHADIAEVKIMPTYQEITTPRGEYLPTTDSSQWHRSGIIGRLDREFRLLREDTVGQLRDACRDMLERIRNTGHDGHRQSQNSVRTSTYGDAVVQDITLEKIHGLELTVKCNQPDVARRMTNRERQVWWEHCKRLQSGALVCVLDAAGMIQFFVVADTTLRIEEKKEDSQRGANQEPSQADRRQLTLSTNQDHLYVKLNPVGTTSRDIRRALQWYRGIGSSPQRYLVEFPGVLLASFKHTLEALQQLSRAPDLPFADLIAPENSNSGTEAVVSPPFFARAPGFEYDLQCLTQNQQAFPARLGYLPAADEVSTRTGLDLTQSAALLNTLSRELSLIQGPPGTGKSYTGKEIIKVLLANKTKAKLGPIICVCYTNHALDQLLEHLLDDGINGIIRMGSRSKAQRLENLNLRIVSAKMDLTKDERAKRYQVGQELKKLERQTSELLLQLKSYGSLTAIRAFLLSSNRAHHDELLGIHEEDQEGWATVQRRGGNVVDQWLNGRGQFGSGPSGLQSNSRGLDVLQTTRLADMTLPERSKLHRDWLKNIRDRIITELVRVHTEHNREREQHDRIRQEVRRRCLQQADIIGVTTTGLARDLNLLRKLQSKVVVCEEAGEVLEAHILTTFLPSVEHAILIGDHLQLRPQIQNYELQSTNPRGAQYSLDTSLFERLVQPPHLDDLRLPVSVLETQRRMHPSISEMVRSTLYNTLKDAESVKDYPLVMGVKHRLFWFHHEHLEAGAVAEDPQDTSHSNDFEIEMTAALVSHLVRQGRYDPDDIAVVVPYLGQLFKLRVRMAAEPTLAVNVGERDIEDLEELEEANRGVTASSNKQSVAKTTLLRSVRLATVDNFQGEEAKVVIISLVRSNPQNRCGFLSTPNRINVLMSRAKHGCYIIGNSKTYMNVPMWSQIIQMLQAEGKFGTMLELQCPRHPDTPILVRRPDDFAIFSPDAGCTLPCDRRLDCGHACYGPCHSTLVHKAVKCHEKCPRPKKGCDHACPLECGDPCEDKCNVILRNLNLKLPCGHILQSARCWEVQDPTTIRCQELADRKVSGCGHLIRLPCHVNVNTPNFKCQAECSHNLPCGHTCRSKCHKCNIRQEGQITESNHGICAQPCGRNYTTCPHTCQQTCHGEAKCRPCEMPCEVRCSHSRCSKPCHEPCAPCAEQDCASSCPHRKCTMPCAAPCDWVPCSQRCQLLLGCGHQCPSLCGEACPDEKFCQQCGSEDILSTVVDYYVMTEYKDTDLKEDPCIFPDCGHFLARSSMDGQMAMGEHYDLDANDIPVAIKNASKPFLMDEVKSCSQCRGSLRNVSRYGRIVRRAMLDEATKKFISWSGTRHLELAERLLQEQQKLEQNPTGFFEEVGRPAQLDLTGNTGRQLRHLNKWIGRGRYKSISQLYVEISKYMERVRAEEQPFQKVADFVHHANRNHRTQSSFAFEESEIQLRGYMLAISLLLKCNTIILSDFMSFWRGAVSTRTEIKIDFADNMARCRELIKLASETDRPQLEAEGHIYYAQFCGFALVLDSTPTANSRPVDAAIPGEWPATTATQESEQNARETLKTEGLEHVEKARAQLRGRSWSSKEVMESDLESAASLLDGGVFYRNVTADEMRAVYQAMAQEFSGTGHWYTCENGHPFTVGECGMPMEQARCPECEKPVGGQHHQPAAGVGRADVIEELGRNARGLRI